MSMSGRRRQRLVIIDSSSSEEEGEEVIKLASNTNRAGTLGWNDDASDSSSSLEGYLRSLRVVDDPPEPENMEVVEEQADVNSDLEDSSSDESVEQDDIEVVVERLNGGNDEDSNSIVVELPPTRDEEEQAGIDVDSAFSLDRMSNEVYLSSDKAKDDIQWPGLRVPVPLFQRLYDYQKTGVSWMAGLHENRIGGILGDDMGMVRCGACPSCNPCLLLGKAYSFLLVVCLQGKTYMTLTYLGGLMRKRTIRNALVIAPLSVLRAWENEAHKVLTMCVPNVRIQVVSSTMGANNRRWALEEALEW